MNYKKILFLFGGLTIATGIFAGPMENLEAEAREMYKENLINALDICINHPGKNKKCKKLRKYFVDNRSSHANRDFALKTQKAAEEISEELYNKCSTKVVNRKMHEKYFRDGLNEVVNSMRKRENFREDGQKASHHYANIFCSNKCAGYEDRFRSKRKN